MRSVFSFSAIFSLQLNLSFSKTLKRFRNWQFHSNATKTQVTFWSGVHFKPTTILELLNALAHVAILVLSFITWREYWDPRDPLRSLFTLCVSPPMSFTAKLALIAINYTLVKQEDDQVTDSENTFATQKEMTRTHPNWPLDTLISLIALKQHLAICGFSLHLGSTEGRKTLEQKFIFQIGTLNPHGIHERFSFN